MRVATMAVLLLIVVGPTTAALGACGDGFVDGGEQCDDGNVAAGDCCAPDCTAEPAGGACPSDDLCLSGTCNGFGHCTYADSCTDQPVYGTKLVLRRNGTKEKLVWLAKDLTYVSPAPDTPADPRFHQATLELFAPFEAPVSMPIPPGSGPPGWRLSERSGNAVWRFTNPSAPLGPSQVRTAVLKGGRTLKVVAKSVGFPLDGLLSGVGIRLVTGSIATCSYFHVGTVLIDAPGNFKARDAGPFFGSCDRGILGAGSPSGAFVDAAS